MKRDSINPVDILLAKRSDLVVSLERNKTEIVHCRERTLFLEIQNEGLTDEIKVMDEAIAKLSTV